MTRRILVVDDDIRVHELIRWALRAPGFEVHAFSDPQRAIVRVLDIKPDMIICDMMMPSMDGQLFLKLVKQIPGLKRTPFLFLTAVRLGSEVDAALKAGADAYLVKPFPLAKLVETVESVLLEASRRSADEPEGADTQTGDAAWPPTPLENLLATQAAGIPQASRTRRIDAPGVPSAAMATRGATALSGTPLGPPGRADDATEPPAGGALAEGPAPVFEGRFSTVELEIGRVKVVTQAESRPNFVITTVLSLESAQAGLKKIETFWCHPLHRHEDLDLVKRQIELQHERAVEDAHREPLFGPRRDQVWRRGSPEETSPEQGSSEPGPSEPGSPEPDSPEPDSAQDDSSKPESA